MSKGVVQYVIFIHIKNKKLNFLIKKFIFLNYSGYKSLSINRCYSFYQTAFPRVFILFNDSSPLFFLPEWYSVFCTSLVLSTFLQVKSLTTELGLVPHQRPPHNHHQFRRTVLLLDVFNHSTYTVSVYLVFDSLLYLVLLSLKFE